MALDPGLYEKLITRKVDEELKSLENVEGRIEIGPLDPVEAPKRFAHHLARVIATILNQLPAEDRLARQTEIINAVLAFAGDYQPDDRALIVGETLVEPPTELRAIHPIHVGPTAGPRLASPRIPLSSSDLLVNARKEPGLIHSLAEEMPSADEIDLICAFVRWHGLRLLEGQLQEHCRVGKRLRVITTVYTGSTERKALDRLVALGAEVKVSYDTESTRLHAKAWRFHRKSGYSTAYIGSSNLTKSALIDGIEWNVRLSSIESPEVLDKFQATFESYWQESDYELYDPIRDRDRFDLAVARAGGEAAAPDADITFFDLEPRPYQTEMLEKLSTERVRHGRHRNLLVAATGTGKTIVAAFDFARLLREHGDLTLLFVAHRQEILKQSLRTFRQVLRDGTFGEEYVGGLRPSRWRHVFASIQSLHRMDFSDLPDDYFDVVIVDEFHHAEAATYKRLLHHIHPKELIGLTATPERADGESVLSYFGDRIAVELRLWDALERNLLAPFHYFGLNDDVDLSAVRWSRGGYDQTELDRRYSENQSRVQLILKQITDKLSDPRRMRALGFCVSVAHADFMAKSFENAGLPARSVTSETPTAERQSALVQLEAGTIRALFSVDVFNEGVDLPSVDTLLFLRPTESPVVFMQQLGRGLRRSPTKECVTVLDFIGKPNDRFRFDLRYRAITGATRAEVIEQVQDGFPVLPAGCTIQLDRVAQQTVLDNLRKSVPWQRPKMLSELRHFASTRESENVTLRDFMAASGLELEDIYRAGSWSELKRSAGMKVPSQGEHEVAIGSNMRLTCSPKTDPAIM